MPTKTWKSRERQVARFFEAERNPLSGSNAKHTSSDTLHEDLFIEHKHRKRHALYELWLRTRDLAQNEGKLPVVSISQHNQPGFIVMVHSSDLLEFAKILWELWEADNALLEGE